MHPLQQTLLDAVLSFEEQKLWQAMLDILEVYDGMPPNAQTREELRWQCRGFLHEIMFFSPSSWPSIYAAATRTGVDIITTLQAQKEGKPGNWRIQSLALEMFVGRNKSAAKQQRWRDLGFVEKIKLELSALVLPAPQYSEPGYAEAQEQAYTKMHRPAGDTSAPRHLTYAYALEQEAAATDPLLRRYKAGRSASVWQELTKLGVQVREARYLPSAVAVARETMRRTRVTCEQLHSRLTAMGYRFSVPEEALAAPATDVLAQIAAIEREAGPLPLSLCAFWEIVGSVNFGGLTWRELDELDENEQGTHPTPFAFWSRLLGTMTYRVDAVRAKLGNYPDPLWIYPASTALEENRWYRGRFSIELAPDFYHKEGVSGGAAYAVTAGQAAADAPFEHEPHATSFVNYLRLALAAGGFPGAARIPRKLRHDLLTDLIPI